MDEVTPTGDMTAEQKREMLARLLQGKARQQECRYPLSFAQQRLWFLDQLEGDATAVYNLPAALRLRGPLDFAAFERSVNEIMRRHESLRTTFELDVSSGQPEQVVHPWRAFPLGYDDLRGGPDPERMAHALAAEESTQPFDLSKGPLLRARLLRLDEEEHVLLCTMHHIVSDGWSVGVLLREMATLYAAFIAGQPSPLPELPIQYADFAHWQRRWLTGDVLERQLNYWRERLGGHLPVLELPTKDVRPARYTSRGALLRWGLGHSLGEGVRELAQRSGATPFMVLLAAFQLLLRRYTNQVDVLLGTPIANRTRRELESLIGFFVNTLVLRADLSGDPPFLALLGRVREACLGAYAHQDVPFERLVEELAPERDLSRTPLFQVMFVLQNAPMPEMKIGDLKLSPFLIDGTISKFDMTLFVLEEEDGSLTASIEYNTDLLDHQSVERMGGHYERLLREAVANPEERVTLLPMLSDEERRRILFDWNDTACDYSLDLCAHQLFEEQAARTPGATALVYESRELTYEELNRRSDALASYLRGRGVGPEVLVGILMDRSIEMVVALLGVLKSGGAYVPLDPTYPRERLAFMLEDAGVRVLLTQQDLVEHLPSQGAELVCLDEEGGVVGAAESKAEASSPKAGVDVQNTAYVIYTSGSTGKPKGVVTSHRAMCNLLVWMQQRFRLAAEDRLLQKTPFSFDASIWEFFWPLISGATLVIARPGGHRDGEYLVEVLKDQRVTILQSVPSLLQVLVEQEQFAECRDLREVFCGGEAFPASLRERFFERLERANLNNVYGPTEAAMHVTHWACGRENKERVVSIGRPLGNTQLYVLDAHKQPVPVGVAGELHIGGVQLARGYLHRPDLTAERFIPDPYSKEPGARLYRTGDLTRFREDGSLEFLGRIDHQVKIRGYRIEPGEIEAQIGSCEGVQEALVAVREDTPGDKRLIAYVVPQPGRVLETGELRHRLSSLLPEYMIPSAFVLLEELPLTPSGKVDRTALPAPDSSRRAGGEEYVEPRTQAERQLAAIFSEVLGVERVGAHDNFFLLGGHSLSASQVISRVRETLRVDVPLRRMFETPTVAGLAEGLESAEARHEEEPIEVISRAPAEEEAAALPNFLEQMSREELQALLLDMMAKKGQ